MRRLLEWIDHRSGLETAVRNFLYEDIPYSSGWRQVFGSVALFLFLVQGFTGILLALNYAPQPGDAYYSLQYIILEVPAGRLIRGLHHWGASMMIVVVVLHMIQAAVWGAYKKPREATWMVGVVLLLLTLGFGLTGYLLPWDNRAYWATVVTLQIAKLAPFVGDLALRLLGSADGSVGGPTFSRFYTLHTILLPLATVGLMAAHVGLVRKHGVAPQPEDRDRPSKKFYPVQVFRDTAAMFVAFAVLFVLAAAVEAPLGRLADPTDSRFVPRPEWYFLFLFQTLKFFEGSLEVVGAVVLPTLAVALLMLLPFIDRGKAKAVRDRTTAFGVCALAAIGWAALTAGAMLDSPERAAVDTGLPSAQAWTELTPIELTGLAYYRQERCETCHNLGEGEPKLGSTLSTISQRKSGEWIIEHLSDPSSVVPGTPMPPANLTQQSRNSLSAFLLRVTPENAAPLEATPGFALRGAMSYTRNQCGQCHIVNGAGTAVGPPLNGVGERREKEWLIGHFKEPQKYVPDSIMPPYDLPADEMEALVQFLTALPPQ